MSRHIIDSPVGRVMTIIAMRGDTGGLRGDDLREILEAVANAYEMLVSDSSDTTRIQTATATLRKIGMRKDSKS